VAVKEKIIFTCQSIENHVRPLAPVAAACMRQGNEVVVAAANTFGDRISNTYRLPYVRARRDWTTDPEVTQIFARLPSEGNDEFNRQLFTRFLAGPPTLKMTCDILEFAKRWRPDVIMHDCSEFGGYLAAVLLGIPHVSPSRAGEHLPAWLTCIPEDRPLIYVSLGSLGPCAPALADSVLRTYDVILDALVAYPCTAVVAVGRDNVQRFSGLSEHIRIMANAPQPLVLRVADLYIGHGGFGGLREAIDAAIPLLILPFFADQPANAARCAELGLGVTLDPLTVTSADVYTSVADMLRRSSYKKQMRALQRRALALPPLNVSNFIPAVA
jgi:UDP:flavonoid glycosyltransferase YjiC (YdhE family)